MDAMQAEIVEWLVVNGIDVRSMPAWAIPSIDGDQLTYQVWDLDDDGRRIQGPDGDPALITKTDTVTEPSPRIAEWLKPKCPMCGR